MKRKCTPHFGPIRSSLDESGFLNLRACIAILLCALAGCWVLSATLLAFFSPQASLQLSEKTLSFAERVTYQRAIEDVYWRHRIWPKEHRDPKPPLDSVMPQAQLEKKVADYLRKSHALEDHWRKPIAPEQLQAEMDRMAQHTKQPKVLRELFDALGDDPFIIAECLARPIVSERLKLARPLDSWRAGAEKQMPKLTAAVSASYVLPVIASPSGGCTDDTWTPTSITNAPTARDGHTAVWTGSEMIVWGGLSGTSFFNTGGRYNPSTDSWAATSTTGAPDGRIYHTAVWTGSEMIVWGGSSNDGGYHFFNTGGRYNPSTDSWTATSNTNAPTARAYHTAVWAGSEMLLWGGCNGTVVCNPLNTGGRYDPSTDSWTATSTTNAPDARRYHTAVWTGSQVIVWGGYEVPPLPFDTGGRYSPSADSWIATSTTNAPRARVYNTAVWTGS